MNTLRIVSFLSLILNSYGDIVSHSYGDLKLNGYGAAKAGNEAEKPHQYYVKPLSGNQIFANGSLRYVPPGTLTNTPGVGILNTGIPPAGIAPAPQTFNIGDPENGRIVRPCDRFDVDCVRKYFSKNSECKVKRGKVPDPLIQRETVAYLPRANFSFTMLDVELRGLNGKVTEFFINLDTDKAVLAVEFEDLSFYSPAVIYRFNRRAMEPVVLKDFTGVYWGRVTSTVIIPNIKHLDLKKSVVYNYVYRLDPPYAVGPKVGSSQDPQARAGLGLVPSNPVANVPEFILTQGTFYPMAYIQYSICDFGIDFL